MVNSFSLSQRAPALFAIPGIIVGLMLSRSYSAGLPVALLAIALSVLCCRLTQKKQPAFWLLAFFAASTLGFWFYGTLRLPSGPDPDLLNMPPREALVQFEIERVMQTTTDYGQASGVGYVLRATRTSRLQRNDRIFFRLSSDQTESIEVIRGQVLQATGILSPIPAPAPEGTFEAYLEETGIHYRFERIRAANLIRPAPPFKKLCHQSNRRLQGFLEMGAPEDTRLSQVYVAMLLGQKSELSGEQKNRYQSTGTMHLFAISGLHIGVVATVIGQFLMLCRLPRRMRPLLGLPLLYFYVEITGAAPSAVRAFLMVAFFWVSIALQRQRSPLAALAASAVFVLVIDPLQLWLIGFQLSYLVVVSILLFGLPLHKTLWPILRPNQFIPESDWTRIQKFNHWLSEKCLLLLAISFSAWLVSSPLSAGFFGFISPYGVLINLLLVNLATLVICGGIISISLAVIGLLPVAAFLNHSAWLSIHTMDALIGLNLSLPLATIQCPGFPRWVAYLGVLAYTFMVCALSHSEKLVLRFVVPPVIVLLTLVGGMVVG